MEKSTLTTPYLGFKTYQELYDYSINPETRTRYWAKQAERIQWSKNPTRILDSSNPPHYKWFTDGELNITESCVDRWARLTPNNPALIYEGRICGKAETWTFSQLHKELEIFAGVLTYHGVKKGDRVIIYMPMIPLAVCAMLAVARIGAIHSVVFGGFAPKELASRVVDSDCKMILSASCGIEPHKKIDYASSIREALHHIARPEIKRIYVQREELPQAKLEDNEFFYDQERLLATPQPAVYVQSTDPFYILYTSGSTGQPKGIFRDAGGSAVAQMSCLELGFDCQPGDVFFASSDIGWVVGHTYTYGPLLNGSATLLYEGKPNTGHPGVFWEIVNHYKVKSFYTSPTAMRFLKKEDPEGKSFKNYDLSCLKHFGIVGERTDLHTFNWIRHILPAHTTYNDTYWQTESGHTISANFAKPEILPTSPGSCIKPYPGWDVRVLNVEGEEVKPGELGYVVTKLPNPPSFMTSLWENEEAFLFKYMNQYPGYYMTGDAGYFSEDLGYLHISTRIDDVINTAGHRLSTSQIEESLLGHPALAEAAVVGCNDVLKGEVPLGMVVIKSGTKLDVKSLYKELVALVRKDIGPVAAYGTTIIVERLPKTKSGKILRGLLKNMLNGNEYKAPPTIENLDVVDEVMMQMRYAGFGVKVDIEFSPIKCGRNDNKVIEHAEMNDVLGGKGT